MINNQLQIAMNRITKHWNYRELGSFPVEELRNLEYRVRELYLKGNKIKTLPEEIEDSLVELRELYVCENLIHHFPHEMCRLECLQHLDMSGNLLCFLPEEINLLVNLQSLILNDNNLCFLPSSIQTMTELRNVFVNDNNLLWLPQKMGRNFYSTNFSFWRNRLNHVPFKVWQHILESCKNPLVNILNNKRYEFEERKMRNVLKMCSTETEIIIPYKFYCIEQLPQITTPTLLELCLRIIYRCFTQHKMLFLPKNIIQKLKNGPTGFCDLSSCNCPLFQHVILIVCCKTIGRNGNKETLITAYFCSKQCSEKWIHLYKITPLTWKQIS